MRKIKLQESFVCAFNIPMKYKIKIFWRYLC
uniref:Uncharacterized protein n=1 Tax=Siphoviridae sp. ctu9a31 TaxID=2825712 RepID=A0A8S5Q931_9CAUD|nr:MAG TPA: hypothetical protein [Siphoviridae sp. ctu9a31]DAH26513.1 MAG TPA: hypothetical protein [Caudoviricetes sp.]